MRKRARGPVFFAGVITKVRVTVGFDHLSFDLRLPLLRGSADRLQRLSDVLELPDSSTFLHFTRNKWFAWIDSAVLSIQMTICCGLTLASYLLDAGRFYPLSPQVPAKRIALWHS
jgi:hypothetical protein